MIKLSYLALLYCIYSHAMGNYIPDKLIEDISRTWKLISPTIIVEEDLPQLCMTNQWVLCLTTNDVDMNKLIHHLVWIHKERKQDSVIFAGGQVNRNLVKHLDGLVPTYLRSNCPVFMPIGYTNDIKLRLDSNIIFYDHEESTKYKLVDTFAVKGGPPITLKLGSWSIDNGIALQKSLNRWDRRTNLMGTNLINAMAYNGLGAQFLIDYNGTIVASSTVGNRAIVGSKGTYQDQLFYITDRLNFNITTIEHEWSATKLENGSWTGALGVLQRGEADIVTTGTGLNLERNSVIDYLLPTESSVITLIAPKPRGTSPNLWVYVQVFGTLQWAIFLAIIAMLVIFYSIVKLSHDNGVLNPTINIIASGISMAFLFVIQLGDHSYDNRITSKIMSFTLAILTMLMFIHYTTDITAEMTSGYNEMPVRNFEDVIHYGYKVIIDSYYFKDMLATSTPGTAKFQVYKKYIEHGALEDITKILSEPKTLYFGPKEWTSDDYIALKIDDQYKAYGGLILQKDSEFLPAFNHYLMKEFEHGILRRILREEEQMMIGILEPEPLGYDNVIFLFTLLGAGISASMVIGLVELMIKIYVKSTIG